MIKWQKPARHKDKPSNFSPKTLQRWIACNGKKIVIAATALILSVFLLPPLGMIVGWSNTSTKPKTFQQQALQIPLCPSTPWKENENLQGKCPGDLKPYKDATTLSSCASSCCANSECVSWQFREDVGCLQGKDVRLGMEKDGPSGWCSDHPPHRWNGQFLKPHGDTKGFKRDDLRRNACSTDTWSPDQEIGQCFGLGDVKKHASGSAKECMEACCAETKFVCGAWQWNKELGCFYGKGMHSCQGDSGDKIKFAPFVGRRKFLKSRKYTDNHNKPWQMTMD